MMTVVMISAIVSGIICFISPGIGKLTIGAAVYSLKFLRFYVEYAVKFLHPYGRPEDLPVPIL